MTEAALSIAPMARAMLEGPLLVGRSIGHGYVLFGRRVLALTRPGEPRMPNGIETDASVAPGEQVAVGDGALIVAGATLVAGASWDPRPDLRWTLSVQPALLPAPLDLAGRGEGLTPFGDDVLIGYLGGSALIGRPRRELARQAAQRTTALSGTLIELAADGLLPEPAHALLEDGDIRPLLSFGASSGRGIALGLGFALTGSGDGPPRKTIDLDVPLPSPVFRQSGDSRMTSEARLVILLAASSTDRE